ncbi:PI-PLC domain-containing protein [Paenibacillus apiarius]|uniref:Uncharacterized protein n=1 Tax=Paenibacillus apiarius TaxID=46240 RepID=A0ABT4E0M7_9BACL|nr:hypothetical protein [Paenibacillus apiarius]MCY9517646.1 hypothetical protein [Paenibacillus apiarius]MCY9523159.1 hypothetical protein [Paenibacillus apiarius]MCY9554858.1 hypothetical protein [Paenibacillus apiarius]MCY9561266.1 hypothetical protein [Paenibacillus apiarius]MCY9682331.1 hypothetical protein [Paenibacillus apiarius]
MEFISHRVNKKEELEQLSDEYGVEIDLRDDISGRIYMEHDPFKDGEDFEEYLKAYHHGTMILNIKSERIELRVLELLQKYNLNRYFFLDSSFPMIKLLSDQGEKKVALRYSEFEGIDTLSAMQGKVEWVWVDCFTRLPLNYKIYQEIKAMGYKLCLVSPELQGQPDKIEEYAEQIRNENIIFDAICTKEYNIAKWQKSGLT